MAHDDKKFLDNPVLDTEIEINKLRAGGYKFNVVKRVKSSVDLSTVLFNLIPVELVEQIHPNGNGRVFIEGFKGKIDGTVAWAGSGVMTLQSTNAVLLATIAQATLAANALVQESDAASFGDAYGRELAAGAGVDIKTATAASAGDDFELSIWGVIR